MWGIAAIGLVCLALGSVIAASANGNTNSAGGAAPTATVTATATKTATATHAVVRVKKIHVTTTPTRVIATRTRTVTYTYTPPPKPAFGDGTYLVGADIRPGVYRTDGDSADGSCYYARLNDLRGGVNSIASNNNFDGPTVVQIYPSDRALEVSGGCQWRRA